MNVNNFKAYYFIGIGGIGMSAIADYFLSLGKSVSGYDRVESLNVKKLMSKGIYIHVDLDDEFLTKEVLAFQKEDVLVVYTPAISKLNKELLYFKENGYNVLKRAEILGYLSEQNETIAVSGTHGKTTVSTIISHILKDNEQNFTGFVGGISKNYDSNLVYHGSLEENKLIVAEADEYDKSFLKLKPDIAIITSVDSDHLDIYKDREDVQSAFNSFSELIKENGFLISQNKVEINSDLSKIKHYKYSASEKSDFYAENIKKEGIKSIFDIVYPDGVIKDVTIEIPGEVNVENSVAAFAAAYLYGVEPQKIKKSLATWKGVKRRFDFVVNEPEVVYIDDYAHHPNEIKVIIGTVRDLYPDRKISAIFQPHLYSRTRDYVEEFAESLNMLDELILLDIYPAREKPIKGVSSELIYKKVKIEDKLLCNINDLVKILFGSKFDVVLTIGAGDIDNYVGHIKNIVEEQISMMKKC